eukprot:937913-Amphidinium_carterae.1
MKFSLQPQSQLPQLQMLTLTIRLGMTTSLAFNFGSNKGYMLERTHSGSASVPLQLGACDVMTLLSDCLLYTSPSPRDRG